jgi:hypothetical protein
MKGKNTTGTVRRGKGTAGTPRGVSKRDENGPGAGGAGQDPKAGLKWAWRHIPKDYVARHSGNVLPKTALHSAPPPEEEGVEEAGPETNGRDDDIHRPGETSLPDRIRSYTERQDLIEKEMLRQIDGFERKVSALERRTAQERETLHKKTGRAPMILHRPGRLGKGGWARCMLLTVTFQSDNSPAREHS